jgi:hypothetical protein
VSSALWPTKNFFCQAIKEKIAVERIINSTLLVSKDIKHSSFCIYLRVYFKKHISEVLIINLSRGNALRDYWSLNSLKRRIQ